MEKLANYLILHKIGKDNLNPVAPSIALDLDDKQNMRMLTKGEFGPPIFVVGLPRSGTTLLAAMLSSHSHIASGPETHFFSNLSEKALRDAEDDQNWPEMAVDLVGSLNVAGLSVLEHYNVSANDLQRSLIDCPRVARSILDCLMLTRVKSQGKVRWLEKTPNHIAHLKRVRMHFPEAFIVRIVRDPRDSIFSRSQLPWKHNSPIAIAWDYRARYELGRDFFLHDKNCITVKYENLVMAPERTLTDICNELGVQFEHCMIDKSSASGLFSSEREPWKSQVTEDLTTDRVFRWKHVMRADIAAYVSCVLDDFINEFGYENINHRANNEVACVGMTPENLATRELSIIQYFEKGIVLVPTSFFDALYARSAYWINGPVRTSRDFIKMLLLRVLNILPLFSFRPI